jgi:hypothetical protein
MKERTQLPVGGMGMVIHTVWMGPAGWMGGVGSGMPGAAFFLSIVRVSSLQPQKCNGLAHHMQKIGGSLFPNLDTPDTVAKL